MSRSQFLLLVLILLSIIFSRLFYYQLGDTESISLFQQLILFNHLFVEFLLIAGFVAIFVNRSVFLRALAYLIFIVFILVYSLQYISVYLTDEYLSSIAISNFQHIGLILDLTTLTLFVLTLFALIGIAYLTERRFKAALNGKNLFLAAACFILAAGLSFDKYWLSEGIQDSRAEVYKSSRNHTIQLPALKALFNSLARVMMPLPERQELTTSEIQLAHKFGLDYQQQHDFPLIKDFIYKNEIEFSSISSTQARPANIIIFFSEGISARVIQPYNNQYPGLTPGFAEFAQSAMRVDNYYNHTFATYRGLLGQLCSIFPLYGGGKIIKQTDYYCLGNLLEEDNYTSHFLFSQQKNSTELDELLSKAGIENILAQNDLLDLYLQGEPAKRTLALSDQQFFAATIEHLRSLEEQQSGENSPPFFLGLYNIETHAFYKMSDDGVQYAEQDSYILDSIHNYDNAFAKFWEYFKQSSLFENTVVILTTDHAHFQDSDFVSLVAKQADYKPLFVDKIPLLIYHPWIELPASFDAQYASSVDFAPSIAHLLQLNNRSNSFLGRSIFERQQNTGIAYGEGYIYLIGAGGIKHQNQYFNKSSNASEINQMYKVINNVHALEIQGRIWDKGLSD